MNIKFEIPEQLDRSEPYVWLATWGGLGFLKPAPGTWGSLGALPFGVLFLWLGGVPLLITMTIIVTAAGFWAAKKFDTAMGGHDSKMIVIDEVAGMWIALIPAAALNPVSLLVAFLAFRFFDIVKPYPVSFIDKDIPGAAGVMGDDLMAGLYAGLIVLLTSALLT